MVENLFNSSQPCSNIGFENQAAELQNEEDSSGGQGGGSEKTNGETNEDS